MLWIALCIAGLALACSQFARLHPLQRASWVLAPLCPLLQWGPLTHCYLNHQAKKQFLETDPPADHPTARLLRDPAHGRGYVQHGIDPDVIKTHSFLNKELCYEYAHNPLPNRYVGRPRFGHALWQAAENPDEQLMALGWISHQVADQFAHNIPFDRFFGYVNREAYFGYYWDEVMHHLGMKHSDRLGGSFFSADHWITELIIDSYAYATLQQEFDPQYMLGRRTLPLGLLERVSPDYIAANKAAIAQDYRQAPEPIEARPLRRCREFADLVNAGTYHYVHALIAEHGAEAFREKVLGDPKFAHLQTMLDLVVAQIVKVLADPDTLYQPVRIDGRVIQQAAQAPEAVETGELTADDDAWWNPWLYEGYKTHRPHKSGVLYHALRFAPLGTLRWIFATFPLTAQRGSLARTLIPKGSNNIGLAIGYALRLRQGEWETFPGAMEDLLKLKGLLGENGVRRERLRTY